MIHIFETLLKEYQETPYEKFFLFSQKILEKIISDPDKQTSKDWIEKLILDLQSNPETEPLHLHILNLIISTRENLDKLSLNPPQERTETRTQVHSTYLKRIARDEEIYSYLDLDNWQSADNKKEACRRIIDCFRKKNHKLDLSGLNLTTLPELPDFFWVKELDLSKNEIQTLEPLSAFKYLETLDLSYNKMSKIDGIPNFLPLKKLERLQSLKLLYMGGSSNLLMNRIKKDLANCDHIEWTDRFTLAPCSFSRRPGELLIDFLPRRNRALDPLSIFSALTISSSIPSIAETTDPSPSENALSHALEVLQITDLDISSLTSQDSNILPWICRLAGQDKHRGLIFAQDEELRPVLSNKVREILECARDNPDFFKNILTPLVSDSIILCGDRTLYNLNEIIRRMELFKTKDLSLEECLEIFRKYFPVALVKKIARQSIEELPF